jgi:flagellar biosynthesis protein FliP
MCMPTTNFHDNRHALWVGLLAVAAAMLLPGEALAQLTFDAGGAPPESTSLETQTQTANDAATSFLTAGPDHWTSKEGLASSLQIMLLLTVISLAPAVLLMTTSFVRIIVVLGLLRQALGAQQLPPSQVITSLALFMTLLIMTPVWKQVYDDAIAPYTDPTQEITLEDAWTRGLKPIREFMSRQIEMAGNSDDIWMFYEYLPADTPEPETYDDVPIHVLAPAYILSELKVAFLIGFQVYLPFLILDIVVASVTISMGMMMLPPVMISLPFKLLLFVMVDGWRLVVGMLLESFAMGMG